MYVDNKRLGNWTNIGPCEPLPKSKSCGPGEQKQRGICFDGINERCVSYTEERVISCDDAGTPLPKCPGLLFSILGLSFWFEKNIDSKMSMKNQLYSISEL